MTIDIKTLTKRFGEPNTLRLPNGVKYNSWMVARHIYDELVPNVESNVIVRTQDFTVKRTDQITLFINNKQEKIALMAI